MLDAPAQEQESTTAAAGRRIAPWIALGVAAVIAALFVVLAGSDDTRTDTVTNFAVGKPAPAMLTTTLDGKPFDLSRRKGSWVVLNFFNTTCLPCKAEHPELVDVRRAAAVARGQRRRAVHGDVGRRQRGRGEEVVRRQRW